MEPFDSAVTLLADAERILVFTGAGMSTESGIPDFRGPDGVWKRIDPKEFTYQRYVSRRETRERSWQMRYDSPMFMAQPNDGHTALVRLWESGRMLGCVTQNIDGLHQAAGLPEGVVVELHGTAHRIRCLSCRAEADDAEVRARWEDGESDPGCLECGGILKAAVVSFGEAMPAAAMDIATTWATSADVALAIGSTLSVYPAAFIPLEVAERGRPLIILNRGPTDHDHMATVRLDGAIGDLLPPLVDAVAAS